tara:strand:+ start:143 stop:265 length:123 start_codon:yes stop_codon:yes gene_type:complete
MELNMVTHAPPILIAGTMFIQQVLLLEQLQQPLKKQRDAA